MRNLFKSFNPPNEAELNNLWKNATFVFDTNILTNLYKYQSSTSEALLKVMEQLGDRVWIPYHVALEYQRNRPTIIHGQYQKFDDTKSAVKGAIKSLNKALKDLQLEKRHSHINPDNFINEVTSLSDKFCLELDSLETETIRSSTEDYLLHSLEKLFEGKVGDKPTSEDIKDIEKEGQVRFDNLIPPGYKDKDKAKEKNNLFTFSGVEYQRHYGDLIVWKQLLSHIEDKKIKHVIFVTDDSKEDWWQITKGKTTGFRPELIDEIYSKTDLDCFHAYNSVSFLNNSNTYLGKTVPDDVIEDVELISKNNESVEDESKISQSDTNELFEQLKNQESDARKWLEQVKSQQANMPEWLKQVKNQQANVPEWLEQVKSQQANVPEWLEQIKSQQANVPEWLEQVKNQQVNLPEWLEQVKNQQANLPEWLEQSQTNSKDQKDN